MKVVEKEVTRWELRSADIANVYAADRTGDIQLWWTPTEELKAFVLNVFSPLGRVFWNVDEYASFRDGAVGYLHDLRAKESTIGILDELIRDTGAELKSDLGYDLLGGFTRYFGDRYEPRHSERPGFLPYDRHMSFAVPEACQPMVSRYFRELARVSGESAARACPENVAQTYFRDESNRPLYGLLCNGVFRMSEDERNAVVALVRSELSSPVDEKSERFFFTANAIGITAFGVEADCGWLDDFAEIARFRVEMAVRYCSLSGIERLKQELAEKAWGLLCLADLRDELRKRVSTVLAQYPVIETNPFELADRRTTVLRS